MRECISTCAAGRWRTNVAAQTLCVRVRACVPRTCLDIPFAHACTFPFVYFHSRISIRACVHAGARVLGGLLGGGREENWGAASRDQCAATVERPPPPQSVAPERGFSDAKALPGSSSGVVALKTIENTKTGEATACALQLAKCVAVICISEYKDGGGVCCG